MGLHLDDCERVPLAEIGAAAAATAMNETFAGYVVPVNVTPEALEVRFRGEDLDPFASALYRHDGANVALVFVAHRGWTARIAAMAVAPPFRGLGLGRAALVRSAEDATRRGERHLILECYEANSRARVLYESAGFRVRRRLVGFERPGMPVAQATINLDDPDLTAVDPSEFARRISADEDRGLPWQVNAATLSALAAPHRAFGDENTLVAVSDPRLDAVRIVGLYVAPAVRRKHHASRLLALFDRYCPGRTLRVPPIVPEGLADAFFARAGWQAVPEAQVEMVRPLG